MENLSDDYVAEYRRHLRGYNERELLAAIGILADTRNDAAAQGWFGTANHHQQLLLLAAEERDARAALGRAASDAITGAAEFLGPDDGVPSLVVDRPPPRSETVDPA